MLALLKRLGVILSAAKNLALLSDKEILHFALLRSE